MTLAIEFAIEDEAWFDTAPWFRELALRGGEQAILATGLSPRDMEVSALLANDARIAELNREFRKNAAPTNVLSWPAHEVEPSSAPSTPPDGFLGDIAFARETIEIEAQKQQIPTERHFAHLFVHGVLHLLGYDHQTVADAAVMEGLERDALAVLGIPDPYGPADE